MRGRHVAAVLLIVFALAACGTSAPTVIPVASPSVSPTPVTEPPTASPSPSPTASAGTSHATGDVAYDPTLLDVLPADVDGLTIESQPDAVAAIASDPMLALAADRIAFGVVADAASGELAAASVIHLRAGVMGDALFRAYRDTYDKGACEPAGGLSGNAEAVIAGRTTYIGTCAGGAHTYHVFLESQQVIVSVVAIGETRRLGERLIEGLRD